MMSRYQKVDLIFGEAYPAAYVADGVPPVRKDRSRAGEFMTGAQPTPLRLPDPMPITKKLDAVAARIDALAQAVRRARTRT
jgi:hypothetical protein